MYETRAGTVGDDDDLAAAVHAAREGDEDGFRVVYRALQPGILRYLRTLVGEEAEDVASDSWVQIVRGMGSFSGGADDFRAWTTTIARNRAIDHLRKVQRRPVADTRVEDLVGTRAAVENTAEAVLESIGTDEAVALLARLPRDQAEALVLRIVLDLDVETTARILGKRTGAVRSAAHRGLRRLAKLLGAPSASGASASGAKGTGASGSGANSSGSAAGGRRGAGSPAVEGNSGSPAEDVTGTGSRTLNDLR
ncbi:RNA polymerase sigma factor [Wenjunlia tyrosinilytica]|uniref:RNA polymerase sigma factor n=1 Tax=Wenjunlia tyrosinilytica TaxID=1544741 RepID=UPI001E31E365|nr:RNA polymerase sigma factor [Wenjunlia tyrosinilytica]